MTTAFTWVMADRTNVCRYILLDHVLVAIDGPAETAVAHAYTSVEEAHDVAVRHTRMDETVGWHMRGDMVMINTYVDPDKVADVYRTERAMEAGLRLVLQRVYRGYGTVLT